MPAQYTRGDSLYEFLSGSLVDGGPQANPNLSLGGYRSSTEAVSLGVSIANPIPNAVILYACGGNPQGPGQLVALDGYNLTWQPSGASSPGDPVTFAGTNDIQVVEASNAPGQYLRIQAPGPFTPGTSTITLSYLFNNLFGLDNITIAVAASGGNEYRASIVRNQAINAVSGFQRCVALQGTPQVPNLAQLSGTVVAGTLSTTGSFVDWPSQGWCQVQSSGGTLKEVVYYQSRSSTMLNVPGPGRAQLGTSATAGSASDNIYPVPGCVLGLDPSGVRAFGSGIQSVATANTAPSGVVWNYGVTPATGILVPLIGVNQQIGIWVWRQTPAGMKSTPQILNQYFDEFGAY
jgi:hypothetical protein